MLKKLFSKKSPVTDLAPNLLSASDLGVHSYQVSSSALQIIEQLEKAGYQAYLVGGGVRDLLVEGRPKDFDIATSATPEQIKSQFRSARIIGRRFRIVHVRMGREVTEVTTFRAHHDDGNKSQATQAANGMLIRDNVYGDIQSDALRRDFTMNALYYSPGRDEIIDYANGIDDVKNGLVRMIGDPETRYQEDPVRMLRAARLAAKLGFTIEASTAKPIEALGQLLINIPPARLFDESLKLFMSGYAEVTYQELKQQRLFRYLFPATAHLLDAKPNEAESELPISQHSGYIDQLIQQAAANTDSRIHTGKRVTPAFIFAVILWPAVAREQHQLNKQGVKGLPAMQQAGQIVLREQVQRVAIPRRFTQTIKEIWDMQLRLPRRAGNQAYRALEHPRFRAAYDFLLLREQAGEDHQGLGQWWTDFQAANEDQRAALVSEQDAQTKNNGGPNRKRRSRPRRRKPASSE
ncbi:polynucleotide adenylyltransferase PcnB [Aurantivibrio infirmus]